MSGWTGERREEGQFIKYSEPKGTSGKICQLLRQLQGTTHVETCLENGVRNMYLILISACRCLTVFLSVAVACRVEVRDETETESETDSRCRIKSVAVAEAVE